MQQNDKRLRSINVISSEMKWSREILHPKNLFMNSSFFILFFLKKDLFAMANAFASSGLHSASLQSK